MLIYLDANIVQYCADYRAALFRGKPWPARNANFLRELQALQRLIELEQFGHWEFAASGHLLGELHRGRPRQNQLETYDVLANAAATPEPAESEVDTFLDRLQRLGLQRADKRHLATACAMGASWFITNDLRIVRTVDESHGGQIGSMRITTPSGSLQEISVGLFLA